MISQNFGSTSALVIVRCLMAPSHYLNQSDSSSRRSCNIHLRITSQSSTRMFENHTFKFSVPSKRAQWVEFIHQSHDPVFISWIIVTNNLNQMLMISCCNSIPGYENASILLAKVADVKEEPSRSLESTMAYALTNWPLGNLNEILGT